MKHVEFGDFYRFCVSLGLALLLAAILAPWLIVKDPSLLSFAPRTAQVEPVDRRSSTELAAIAQAQSQRTTIILAAHSSLPWVAAFLAFCGLGFFAFGLWNWWKLQRRRDLREKAEIDRVLSEMPQASLRELEAKERSDEVVEDFGSAGHPGHAHEPGDQPKTFFSLAPASTHSAAENLVISLLTRSFTQSYEVERFRKLKTSVIDAVLISKTARDPDFLIEIRLIRRGFKVGWLYEVVQKLSVQADLYFSLFNRRAVGLVVIVIGPLVADVVPYLSRDDVRELIEQVGNVRVRIINLSDLNHSTFDTDFLSSPGICIEPRG